MSADLPVVMTAEPARWKLTMDMVEAAGLEPASAEVRTPYDVESIAPSRYRLRIVSCLQPMKTKARFAFTVYRDAFPALGSIRPSALVRAEHRRGFSLYRDGLGEGSACRVSSSTSRT